MPVNMALVVDTAVEGSELYCYNTEGNRNSVVSQVSSRMGRTLLELQAETGIEKRSFHMILRENLHMHKLASKRMSDALSEVKKLTRYAISHLLIIIHTSKSS